MEITKQDLSLALYGEITDEIARGNDQLIHAKIQIGTAQMYGYLNRFDADTMFAEGFEDPLLKQLTINIIVWHLAALCNPNIHMDIIRTNYEDAVRYMEQVQKGLVRPNWPIRPNDPANAIDEGGNIQWSSNPKRNNHY